MASCLTKQESDFIFFQNQLWCIKDSVWQHLKKKYNFSYVKKKLINQMLSSEKKKLEAYVG